MMRAAVMSNNMRANPPKRYGNGEFQCQNCGLEDDGGGGYVGVPLISLSLSLSQSLCVFVCVKMMCEMMGCCDFIEVLHFTVTKVYSKYQKYPCFRGWRHLIYALLLLLPFFFFFFNFGLRIYFVLKDEIHRFQSSYLSV